LKKKGGNLMSFEQKNFYRLVWKKIKQKEVDFCA
jgi:hypothetical protein